MGGTTFRLFCHHWESGGPLKGGVCGITFSFNHGAYSCSFKESLMLMLAFHAPILTILGQCANREDSCCLMVECRQIKADRRSTATLTLGDSGLAVAEEASVSSCADVPNLGQT